jgi:hypothetical protein
MMDEAGSHFLVGYVVACWKTASSQFRSDWISYNFFVLFLKRRKMNSLLQQQQQPRVSNPPQSVKVTDGVEVIDT